MDLTKGILRTLSGSEEYKMFLISFSKESEQKVDYSHYKREYNYRARKNKDKTFFFCNLSSSFSSSFLILQPLLSIPCIIPFHSSKPKQKIISTKFELSEEFYEGIYRSCTKIFKSQHLFFDMICRKRRMNASKILIQWNFMIIINEHGSRMSLQFWIFFRLEARWI